MQKEVYVTACIPIFGGRCGENHQEIVEKGGISEISN